nr:IS110 family transposase [Actinokineospora iranica]
MGVGAPPGTVGDLTAACAHDLVDALIRHEVTLFVAKARVQRVRTLPKRHATADRVLLEIGDASNLSSGHLTACACIAPVTHSSGSSIKDSTRPEQATAS